MQEYCVPSWGAIPKEDFWLETIKNGKIIGEISLREKSYFLCGRQDDVCQVVMEHPSISRRHAAFQYREDGALMLLDLGSAQGTFINKDKLIKDTYQRLYVGDTIKFGSSTRLYLVCGPESHTLAEYDSVNMQQYREKLAKKSEKAKTAKEKEQGASWGFDEEAEESEDEAGEECDDVNENEKKAALPEYLRKMKADENYDRKYGDKFSASIDDNEVTDKDKEVLEKIRGKERKIQNMQEEIKRIYLKEKNQADGLTDGQIAAVKRNDGRIEQLKEEIDALEARIRNSNKDRSSQKDGVNPIKKKRTDTEWKSNGDSEVYDTSMELADKTNWRLKKKRSNLTVGSSIASEPALTFEDIGKKLSENTVQSEGLCSRIAECEAACSTWDSLQESGGAADEVEMALGAVKHGEAVKSLLVLRQQYEDVVNKGKYWKKLYNAAAPALMSNPKTALAGISSSESVGSAVAITVVESAPCSMPPPNIPGVNCKKVSEGAAVLGSTSGNSATDNCNNSTSNNIVSQANITDKNVEKEKPAPRRSDNKRMMSMTDSLAEFKSFVEEEKRGDSGDGEKDKEDVKPQKTKKQRQQSAETPSIIGPSRDKVGADFVVESSDRVKPSNTSSSGKGNSKKEKKGPTALSTLLDDQFLQGGKSSHWIPPVNQSGDGKTSLNAKFGY